MCNRRVRRRHIVPLVSGPAALLTLLLTSPSVAGTATAADALFEDARMDMERGAFSTACPKFKQSYEIDPGVGTLLNLAVCYESLGKLASAWSTYKAAAADARKSQQPDREELARKEVARLNPLLAKIRFLVSEEQRRIEGLRLTKDGEEIPEGVWDVPLPVDEGEFRLIASAPGYTSVELSVQAPGQGKILNFEVPLLKKEGAVDSSIAASPDSKDAGSGQGAGAGPWILSSVGLAVAATGGVFLGIGQATNSKALAICPNYPDEACSADEITDWQEYHRRAQSQHLVAYTAFGVGGAAVLGSIIWLVLASPKETGTQLAPWIAPEFVGLSVSDTF